MKSAIKWHNITVPKAIAQASSMFLYIPVHCNISISYCRPRGENLAASAFQWIKVYTNQKGPFPLIMQVLYQPRWMQMVDSSLERTGLLPGILWLQNSDRAKCIVKQRVHDIQHQQDLMKTPNIMVPVKFTYVMTMAQ